MKILLILACLLVVAPAFTKTDKAIVSVQKLNKTKIEQSLFFPVQIQSKIHSQILSDNQYIVIKKLVQLGQKIKKGTPLLVLRNQDMSVHYENRILRAPVSGIIASINISQGQYINRNDSLILINDPTNLIGKIEASAADYNKLKRGLEGTLNINSLNIKGIPVSIQGIGAAVDHLTGTISVELAINKQMEKLIPGVIGLAEIILNKEEKTLIGEKSLYYIGNEIFVATLEENKVKKVKVKVGKRFKEKIELLNGLEVGQRFISESAKFLRDGEEVEIKETKEQ